jgi:uncharacterized protein YjbJ (UPF0337 family)
MGTGKRFAHKAEVFKGSVRQTVGRITGNRKLRAQGRRDQFKGNAKQTWAKVKRSVKR